METFLPIMLAKSIGLAATNATISPGIMRPWVEEIEQAVAEKGKFSKLTVAYIPLSPPPVFWDYKCRKCLPAGEPIVTDHGLAPIQKISVGIKVLAQDGRYHRVIARGSRPYKGDIYKVRPKGSLVFRLTPDHLVLSSDGWKEIRDLHKEDAILFPIPREEEPLEYIPANLGLPGFLKVSADLLRLMGYYVAEGSQIAHQPPGEISPSTTWQESGDCQKRPPDDKPAFSWIEELRRGDW